MNYQPPGTWGVLKLLARTSLRRLLRAAQVHKQKNANKERGGKRSKRRATARKRGDGLMWLLVLMLPVFVFQALLMTGMAVQRLGDASAAAVQRWQVESIAATAVSGETNDDPADFAVGLAQERYGGGASSRSRTRVLADVVEWRDPVAKQTFLGCGVLLLLSLFGMLLAIGFGGANANLAGGQWTQAWLMTFPVATRSLVLAKALEYSFVQFFPWLTVCPLTYQLLRALGQPGALAIAIGATLLTTCLTGGFRLWLETWLRMKFSLRGLRSVQGACTLAALLLMALAFGVCLAPSVPNWFVDVGSAVPAWFGLLPAAWPVALASHGSLAAVIGATLTIVVFVFACTATSRLLAAGTMTTGGVDAGQRGVAGAWLRARRLGVAGKDLAMLLRDRNFLVQTLVVPIFVVGLQLLVNPGLGKVGEDGGTGVPMLAYGIGMYALIGGCFQVLSGEGRALWMLYSLPVSIAEVLRRKTRIWASVAVGFGVAALIAFSLRAGELDFDRLLSDASFVGIGIWGAAHLAAAISVLGCNPAADFVPRQPKARHVYLYFFFASIYFVGLASDSLFARVAGALVFATIAYAVWQRACDRLPWLLDPVDEARARVSLYDGAVAMLVFFLLQSLVLAIMVGGMATAGDVQIAQLLWAFVLSGLVALLLSFVLMGGRGVAVLDELGLRLPSGTAVFRSSALALLAGTAAGMLGLGYLRWIEATGWFELPPAPPPQQQTELLLLAVVAAPIIEELLFRGLVFGGLVRSVRPWLAVLWSSALFACVHPSSSWLPVFVMGVVAALVFRRTQFLPAAMLVHASYNFVVVALR